MSTAQGCSLLSYANNRYRYQQATSPQRTSVCFARLEKWMTPTFNMRAALLLLTSFASRTFATRQCQLVWTTFGVVYHLELLYHLFVLTVGRTKQCLSIVKDEVS